MDSNTQTQNKHIKILEVANRLFAKNGFHETKLEQVAKEADIAKGTLYLYFRSKEDLFLQCLVDGHEKDMALTEAAIAKDASIENRLEELLELQLETSRRNGPLVQKFIEGGQVFSKKSDAPKKFLRMLNAKVALVASFFEEGTRLGVFSDRLSPTQMALIFQQFFNLNLNFQVFKQPPLSSQLYREILVDLFSCNSKQAQ